MATSGSFTGSTANNYITPKIVWSATQSTTGNTSTITAKLYYSKSASSTSKTYGTWSGTISIGGQSQSFGGVTITLSPGGGDVLVATFTQTISHASDGSLSVAISATGAISGTTLSSTTISSTVTLDTIARASTLSVAAGTLGTSQTLVVTRQSTGFTHTIVAVCGNASTTVVSKSASTSISFTPPLTWAYENTSGTSVTVKYTITTYSGSTAIGSNSYTVSCYIPASVKPSCSVSVTDATGYASTYGGYIKGLSKFKVTVTATTSYSSAIASYKTTANGSTYTASSFVTELLKSSGTLTISATVTDKRSRSGSASKAITVLDYAAPAIPRLTVGRCDSDGTANDQGEYVKVTFSYTATSLSNKNNVSCVLQYKKTSDTDYTTNTVATAYSVTNQTFMFAADTGSSYDVVLTVTDAFTSTSRSTSASTGFTLMHWKADGTGVGIGKISERSNALEIGLSSYFFQPVGGQIPTIGAILEEYKLAEGTDINNVLTFGDYKIPSYALADTITNLPENTAGVLRVRSAQGGYNFGSYAYVLQEFFTMDGYYYVRGVWTSGTENSWTYGLWKSNQWPMELGKEYCTLERYLGKAVYVKVIDFGTLPNNAQKMISHGLTTTAVVGLEGASTSGKYHFPSAYSKERVDLYINATNIVMTTDSDWSGVSAYVTVKYTKD